MGQIFCWIAVVVCLAFGFWGCFVNKIPGPIAVLLATIIAMVGLDMDFGWGTVAIIAVLAILSMVLSKLLVKGAHKLKEFSKKAGWGTTIGSIIGLSLIAALAGGHDASSGQIVLYFIIAFLVLPYVFAFLLELSEKKGMPETLQCAASATGAYLADSFLKIVVFGYAVYVMFFIDK